MADCHSLFQSFDKEIQIPDSKKQKLNSSKGNLRKVIIADFKAKHPEYEPKFWTQGSYKTKTLTRTKDDTCDLDDGIYLLCKQLPNEKPETIQSWVKKAVEDVTDTPSQHRTNCIRVIYAAEYNIDLPVLVYSEDEDKYYLATKKGWKEDDPKAFVNWVNAKNKEFAKNGQLKRIVRFLKCWCDNKANAMPSGLIMTIWAAQNLVTDEKDDKSLLGTLEAIKKMLNNWECKMPTNENEDDLLLKYDEGFKKRFLENLDSFIKDAKEAVDVEDNYLKSSKLWRKHLGNRFPLGKDETDLAKARDNELRKVMNSIKIGSVVTTSAGAVKDNSYSGVTHTTSNKGFYGRNN